MSYNLDGSIRKRGSGRTDGAVSLVSVRFGDLKAFLGDDAQVLMGRKFLEGVGFMGFENVSLKEKPSDRPSAIVKRVDPKKND